MNQHYKRRRRPEVGYVLLEECEVLVPSGASHLARRVSAASAGPIDEAPAPTPNPWRAVDLRHSPDPNDNGEGEGNDGFRRPLPEDGFDLALRPCRRRRVSSAGPAESSPSSPPANDESDDGGFSWRSAAEVDPFDGTLSGIDRGRSADSEVASEKRSIDEGDRSPQNDGLVASEGRRRRRSDASLLAGLALEIARQADDFRNRQADHIDGGDGTNLHLRHLRMEDAKIMFWDPNIDSGTANVQSLDDEGKFARTKASLMLTFSLPTNDGLEDCRIDGDGAGSDRNRKKKKASKSKGGRETLSAAHRLLGSIVRCDWGHLDAMLERLERKRNDSARKTNDEGGRPARSPSRRRREDPSERPLFPDSLDVEELYDRISGAGERFGRSEEAPNGGAPRMLDYGRNEKTPPPDLNVTSVSKLDDSRGGAKDSESTRHSVGFLDLPDDVMATSVAPYLRARTLHSLSVSNRKLFRALRAVVPGLKLKLFRHQIHSLGWMEGRERRLVTEGDLIRGREDGPRGPSDSFVRESESACGGDYHRAVTGGATVLLRPRPGARDDDRTVPRGGALRFDAESGSRIDATSDCAASRGATRCARGGLLCDDPGLGKTITVLSLVLRTFGLGTEAAAGGGGSPAGPPDDDALFRAYWRSSFLTVHVRRPALLRLVRRLIECDDESEWFIPPIREYLDQCPDYLDVIPNPTCLQDIRERCNKGDCRDFDAFERDVKMCFSNARTYNPPHHVVHKAAKRLSEKFDEILSGFKRKQIEAASRSISRMKNDPAARSLVDLLEAKKRSELEEPLVFSSSTLLVVPTSLLQHWEDQMLLHIDFGYISSDVDSPPVYCHTSKRKSKNSGADVMFELRDVTNPLIFIDDGSKALPPPAVLACFPVVLTSYRRFTAEWKNGSIEQEFRASRRGSRTFWGDRKSSDGEEEDVPEASPLLKVSWLRVIVDEGHVMGKNTNNLIQFASWLTAQRRWAMTGTPTRQIAAQNGLKNLYFLANFLGHDSFSKHLGREKVWNGLIGQGWKNGDLSSFFRLRHLVSYLMVRHTKQDLVEIPPPVFAVSDIRLSRAEITTYNTIVSGIRTNIITTSMEGKTSGWQDSLLNPRQSKFASEALTNLRVACCGGLQILPRILNKHWSETLEMLRDIHHLDEVRVQVVNNFIHRAQTAELSSCHSCGLQLQTLFVIPCGHLVCTECIDSETKSCPVCKQPFDVDDFQRLQPGLNFQFSLNILEEKKEREKQYALQRAFNDSTRTGGVADIDELGDAEVDNVQADSQRRSHRKGESCVYSPRHIDGKCTICGEEHFDCNFMANRDQCSVCHKFAEECPPYASKSKHVIDKLLQLLSNDRADGGGKICNVSPMAARLFSKRGNKERGRRPLKAIVFSQFRTIYEYFGDRLIRRFGGACVADYSYAKTRAQELKKFVHNPECFVMLLSKEGSVGLDLSFVTHIFFLDSIYDKALEAQVVARAYRMGATGPVFVDELMAKDSVEEVMIQMNANHQAASQTSKDQKEKHAKLRLLLKSARLVRPQQEPQIKKRKVQVTERRQNNDAMDSKQKAKTARVRFKE